MEQKIEKIDEAYFAKTEGNTTLSGVPLKKVYSPEDAASSNYEEKVGNPGNYPFTRGIYADMFRGRYWSSREICGYASPRATNQRLKELVKEGESALNAIGDFATNIGIDSDHPYAEGSVGAQGVPICSYQDMEALADGLPMDKVSFMLTLGTHVAPASYYSIARERGIPLEQLRGTTSNAPLNPTCIYGPPEKHYEEIPWKMRLYMDSAEFSIRNMPRWNAINVNGYVVREGGCTAAQEIAISFSQALTYVDALMERGLTVDEILPRMSFTFTCHMDFFEEIAKFRAARRLWANLIKERYNPKEEKTYRLKYHTNTAGESLQHAQPMNNVIRVAIEALAAVIGGTQSLQTCSYDEGIDIPTPDAQRLALRTQQIIAHESGVTNVVDTLGGSYFIENLTDKLEEDMREFIATIDEKGGYIPAIQKGWVSQKVREVSLKVQRDIESGERILVGTNAYNDEPEEERPIEPFQVPMDEVEHHLESLRKLRETRDEKEVKRQVERLGEAAGRTGENLTEYYMDAAKAGATAGEATGAVRMAHGDTYDVFEVLEYPF